MQWTSSMPGKEWEHTIPYLHHAHIGVARLEKCTKCLCKDTYKSYNYGWAITAKELWGIEERVACAFLFPLKVTGWSQMKLLKMNNNNKKRWKVKSRVTKHPLVLKYKVKDTVYWVLKIHKVASDFKLSGKYCSLPQKGKMACSSRTGLRMRFVDRNLK